jgi:hypothetical protein
MKTIGPSEMIVSSFGPICTPRWTISPTHSRAFGLALFVGVSLEASCDVVDLRVQNLRHRALGEGAQFLGLLGDDSDQLVYWDDSAAIAGEHLELVPQVDGH